MTSTDSYWSSSDEEEGERIKGKMDGGMKNLVYRQREERKGWWEGGTGGRINGSGRRVDGGKRK